MYPQPHAKTATPQTKPSTNTTNSRTAKKILRTILAPPSATTTSHSPAHLHEHLDSNDSDDSTQDDAPLYDVPIQHYNWGETQVLPHGQWGGLFFDLTYVGVAYKLGVMLKNGLHPISTSETNTTVSAGGDNLEQHDPATFLAVLGLFIAMFSSIENCWFRKMTFASRFRAEDLVHRTVQIILGCLTAVAALSIEPFEVMNAPYSVQAMTFSAAMLAHTSLDSTIYAELTLWGKTENARGSRRFSLIGYAITIIYYVVALALTCSGYGILGPAICWYLAPLTVRMQIIVYIRLGWLPRNKTVPMNVEFCAHRKGEFAMLMLGESIISIIIVTIHNNANFFVTYILSYFLVATICLLHFSCYPSHPNEHAMRRSSVRAVILSYMESYQAMTLIMTGVGFKITLAATDDLGLVILSSNDVWFFSSSLAATLLITICCRVMHHGPVEEFHLHSKGDLVKKVSLWTTKLSIIGLLLVAPSIHTQSWGLMLFYYFMAQLVYLAQLTDYKLFRGHHLMHIETEVLARMLENLGVSKSNARKCAPAFAAKGLDTHEALIAANDGDFEACGLTMEEAKVLCEGLRAMEARHSFEKEIQVAEKAEEQQQFDVEQLEDGKE